MKRTLPVVAVLLIAGFVLASCKSKKNAVSSASRQKEASRNEYTELSKKLNLEVNRNDNIRLYEYVAGWLGTSHKTGGCDKRGVDCSCFVRMAVEDVYGQKLPRTAAEMHKHTKHIGKNNLKEGDLVFFNIKSAKPSHVGIYLKNGWFAHVSTSRGVMINNLDEAYYEKYFTSAGRN